MRASSITGNTFSDVRNSHLQEAMVSISVDGISYAIMLASPFELEDFARGFALSEALIQDMDELRDIHVSATIPSRDDLLSCEANNDFTVNLTLSPRAAHAAKQRRRSLQGSSGCGLCGADAIAHAREQRPPRLSASRVPTEKQIMRAREQLSQAQIRNRQAGGGMHAAALFVVNSATPQIVREDIGRHNALDKLIGASIAETSHNIDEQSFFRQHSYVILTSRCSYELVLKCARANIGTLITFAMPTTLAVECARQCNMTLACFQGPQLFFYHKAMDDTSA